MRARIVASVGALGLVAACAAHRAALPMGDPIPVAPGNDMVRPPGFSGGAAEATVFTRRATGDTAERRVAALSLSERSASEGRDGADVMLVRAWSAPFTSTDSLVVDRRNLLPLEEVLSFGGAVRRYHYEGSRVSGVIARLDSAPQSYEHDFGEPIFAFNEVDALVCSLPFRVGLRVVVPLFSEVDRALERDTISVVGRQGERWVVRFADPVITTEYVVEASSRRIADARTTQRASGVQFHYVYPPIARGK